MGEGVGMNHREAGWRELATDRRPKLVVEVGASAGGGLILPGILGEFEKGTYSDCRYLAVDPDEDVLYGGLRKDYVLRMWVGIEGDQMKEFAGAVDEIWVGNLGLLSAKPGVMEAMQRLLKPGGKIVVFDTSTDVYWDQEAIEREVAFLERYFGVEDLSGRGDRMETGGEVFLEGWKELYRRLDSAKGWRLALRLCKVSGAYMKWSGRG